MFLAFRKFSEVGAEVGTAAVVFAGAMVGAAMCVRIFSRLGLQASSERGIAQP